MRPAMTSESHPLRVDTLVLPGVTGRLGMTFCPGKQHTGAMSGTWARDLECDLERIVAWGADTLVTLMEDHELSRFGVAALPGLARRAGLDWLHWPIVDTSIPGPAFMSAWNASRASFLGRFRAGRHAVVHCLGGKGRTGLVAALVLIELGVSPRQAIATVRAARDGTIENPIQEDFVLDFRPDDRSAA